MNYRIFKYELRIDDIQPVIVPKGAEILSVANKNGALCMWVNADLDNIRETRYIEVIGTGNPIAQDMGIERKFIGTVVINPFVWHVFERL